MHNLNQIGLDRQAGHGHGLMLSDLFGIIGKAFALKHEPTFLELDAQVAHAAQKPMAQGDLDRFTG